MQKSRSGLRPGDPVQARGATWRVVEISPFPNGEAIRLEGTGPENAEMVRTLLHPFDRLTLRGRAHRVRRVNRRRWALALARLVADERPLRHLRCAAAARLDLLPYQLEPALAVVSGATRVLLADEVGLGKTVQAGLIVAELFARGEARCALVLTPAGLREQWASELACRLRLDTQIFDAASLRRQVAAIPRHLNPWALARVAIASIDFVKRPEAIHGLDRVVWDVLVVDEAHVIGEDTERATAVRALASRARRIVLVTATPHDGDERRFGTLIGTGALDADEPIALFRRTRTAVARACGRRTSIVLVHLTPEERRMHELLDSYVTAIERHAANAAGADLRLLAIVLRKRALSSAASLLRSVTRRLRLLVGSPAVPDVQPALPGLLDTNEPDDDVPDALLGTVGFPEVALERRLLACLEEAARAASRRESKHLVLARLLRRTREPAIVFTEYRDTLRDLVRALPRGTSFAVLHGGLSASERRHAIAAFRSGARLLLATDAAGQGLNLHHGCRWVINMELPWNPIRLEQRIGRVDRIGQRRRVHAAHLVARGSFETVLLARLRERLRRVGLAVGGGASILGSARDGVSATSVDGESGHSSIVRLDLSSNAREEAARATIIRALRQKVSPAASDAVGDRLERRGPWWITLRFRRTPTGWPAGCPFLAVVRASIVSGTGAGLATFLVPFVLHASTNAARVATGSVLARDEDLEALRRAAHSLAARSVNELHPWIAGAIEPIRRRDLVILRHLERRLTSSWMQPELFSDRPARRAERERAELERARQRLLGCVARLDPARVALGHVDLMLVASVRERQGATRAQRG